MNSEGVIKISDEVISVVSGIAISEVKGVVGIYDSKSGIFGLKAVNKGVRAEIKENQVTIDIDIVVEYGVKMPEVAWEIQGKIKTAVENMTGLTVDKINVYVKDIALKKEEEQAKEEE